MSQIKKPFCWQHKPNVRKIRALVKQGVLSKSEGQKCLLVYYGLTEFTSDHDRTAVIVAPHLIQRLSGYTLQHPNTIRSALNLLAKHGIVKYEQRRGAGGKWGEVVIELINTTKGVGDVANQERERTSSVSHLNGNRSGVTHVEEGYKGVEDNDLKPSELNSSDISGKPSSEVEVGEVLLDGDGRYRAAERAVIRSCPVEPRRRSLKASKANMGISDGSEEIHFEGGREGEEVYTFRVKNARSKGLKEGAVSFGPEDLSRLPANVQIALLAAIWRSKPSWPKLKAAQGGGIAYKLAGRWRRRIINERLKELKGQGDQERAVKEGLRIAFWGLAFWMEDYHVGEDIWPYFQAYLFGENKKNAHAAMVVQAIRFFFEEGPGRRMVDRPPTQEEMEAEAELRVSLRGAFHTVDI